LALSSADTRATLFGPWLSVYTPAPSHFLDAAAPWLVWPGNPPPNHLSQPPAFTLPEKIATNQRRIDWVYWLDEYFSEYGSPAKVRLPELIANLDLLVENQIVEGRHLLKLSALSAAGSLESQPQVMAILHTTQDAFIKVDQLLELGPVQA
jgi:hypothetical protein